MNATEWPGERAWQPLDVGGRVLQPLGERLRGHEAVWCWGEQTGAATLAVGVGRRGLVFFRVVVADEIAVSLADVSAICKQLRLKQIGSLSRPRPRATLAICVPEEAPHG